MKTVDLTDVASEELQDFKKGQVVETPDGIGVIAEILTETIDIPTQADFGEDETETEEFDASDDNPAYMVPLLEGGFSIVRESELQDGPDELPGDGEPVGEDVDPSEVELAPVYEFFESGENDHSEEALSRAKRRYILSSVEELSADDDRSLEELLNIPGVDDPEVGFASLPPGWTRKSVLQAYATVGGTWSSCRARMLRHFGNRMSKRWCSALKDEVYQTELWRGRF